MNNLNNTPLLNNYKKIYCILLFTILSVFSLSAQQLPLQGNKKYTIRSLSVSGEQSFNEKTVIAFTGLKVGDRIFIPGEKLSEITKKLWEQGLFSDIAFYVTNIVEDEIDLELHIVELPKIKSVTIVGVKKVQQKEIIKDNNLKPGIKITKNLIATTKNYIKNKYREDGYFYTEVDITSVPYADSLGIEFSRHLTININRNKKVKISSIEIAGNKEMPSSKLKAAMKDTKEKSFFRIWKRSKFTESGYDTDKELMLTKFRSNGFRDARIINDSIIKRDDKDIVLKINIEEGKKYYFGNINFIGNSVYTNSQLKRVLGISEGNIYNGVLLQERIEDVTDPEANDLTNLYQNNGYLFSRINPVEVAVRNDTIDFEIRIIEGKIAYFDHITVVGNDKTNDHVIYREIRTRPGQKYSKRNVVRTIRELGQLVILMQNRLALILIM